MVDELEKLRRLTKTITSNGYLSDQTKAWKYAFDSVKELVCVTNPQFQIKYINKPLTKKLETTNREVINKTLDVLFSSDVFSINKSSGVIGDRSIYYGESYVPELDGWYERHRYIIETSAGKLIGYTFMLIDVTARKKATLLLQEKEERFRELFNNMASGVAVYKHIADKFYIVDFNKAASKIEKIEIDDVIGKEVTEVFPGILDIGLLEVFERVSKTGEPEEFPVVFYEDERVSGWRENYIYKLPSGEIVALYTDETERKQFQQQLEEKQRLLEGVLNAIPDIISVQDHEHTIIKYNRAAEEFFKLTSKELNGIKCYEVLGRIHPCDECQTRVCKETKAPAKIEKFIPELDKWYDCRSYPILDENNDIVNVIEHLRDIDDQKKR